MNKQALEEDLACFTKKFTQDFSISTPVNVLWNGFRQMHWAYWYICSFRTDNLVKQVAMHHDICNISRRKKSTFNKADVTKKQAQLFKAS